MQIALFDSWGGKFSSYIKEHWEQLGHKVRFNPTWENASGADINFFYQADNGMVDGIEKELTGKVYGQCVDIEVWAGQANAVNWSKVDGCIFMAKHIQNMVEKDGKLPCKTTLIKPGIDLTKFTLRKDTRLYNKPIRKIAYVVGDKRIWDVKRLDIAFMLLKDLLTVRPSLIWQLHIRGTYSTHEQYNAYCRYLQKDLKLDEFVVWYEDRVEDMNEWLEDKDYFLLPSTKEAFSYATAEAMAKGIKPIINNWESSKDNWAPFVCETYGQMMAEFTKGDYNPEVYRQFVEEHYNQDRYFQELDSFLQIK
jgi:hypothetical protein